MWLDRDAASVIDRAAAGLTPYAVRPPTTVTVGDKQARGPETTSISRGAGCHFPLKVSTPWGYTGGMSQTLTYSVPAMHCGHCERAVREELSRVTGVSSVAVDLETKLVTVIGEALDDTALRGAIEEAGYEAA